MILQALARYYEILAEDPDCNIAPIGFSAALVSFEIVLSPGGELKGITRLFQTEARGKKLVERPLSMIVPEQIKRSGKNPPPNFLCDNCAYVLGISDKGKENDPTYALRRFRAFRDHNLKILAGADCPEARAVRAFLTAYDPAKARDCAPVSGHWEDLMKGGNLVFRLEGSRSFVHNAPAVRRAWADFQAATISELTGQCLVTGEKTAIARLHPSFKGIRGASSMGATLVGFNAPAYESYGREQGLNAQTGERAAFAYGAALNYLLSPANENPSFYLGDTTVVYWAESSNRTYADLFTLLMNPSEDVGASAGQQEAVRRDPAAEQLLRRVAQKIRAGDPLDAGGLLGDLDKDTRFYVLGLAPNVSRVSVRFFHRDPFIKFVERIIAHYKDLEIEREFDTQPARIPVWQIVNETVPRKSRDKKASPLMAGALMRAILNDTPYPAALFNAIINRVRADSDDTAHGIRKINYLRAAVIKAYLTRKYRHWKNPKIEEVLCMSLNEQSTYPAYLMGRLFAVLERAQEAAIPNANATIKDRFFSSACASPVTVFPRLLRLSQHHLAKLSTGQKIWYERLLGQIMDRLEADAQPFPAHLPLDDQGAFVLGYYHQRSAFFKPRTDTAAADKSSDNNDSH